MALYTFVCKLGHTAELLRPMATSVVACSVCGNPAPRRSANRVAVVAPSVDTRGMFSRFVEASAEYDHAAARIEQQTGESLETPNLWKAAKQQAAAMSAAGENPYAT